VVVQVVQEGCCVNAVNGVQFESFHEAKPYLFDFVFGQFVFSCEVLFVSAHEVAGVGACFDGNFCWLEPGDVLDYLFQFFLFLWGEDVYLCVFGGFVCVEIEIGEVEGAYHEYLGLLAVANEDGVGVQSGLGKALMGGCKEYAKQCDGNEFSHK